MPPYGQEVAQSGRKRVRQERKRQEGQERKRQVRKRQEKRIDENDDE
jgi:hypothetical protein